MSATTINPADVEDDFDDYDDPPPPPPSLWRRLGSIAWVRLLCGAPALAAVVAAVVVAITPRGNVEGAYRQLVQEALAADQFERARVGTERLLQIAPFNAEYRFWLALAHDGLGERDFADRLMASLAPHDEAGYGPAHFWRAERMLRQEPITPATVREAERHLRRVDPQQMRAEAVMRRMALVMLKTNRLDEAKEYLAGSDLPANPDLRVAYAEALLQRGAKDDANRELTKAVDDLRDRVFRQGKSAADGGIARRTLAEALALRGDFAGAEQVLQEGIAIGPAEHYARSAAQFYAKWSAAAESGAVTSPGREAVAAAAKLLASTNDGSLQTSGLLSYLYQRTGQFEQAVRLLERLAKTQPDAAFDLVRLHLRLGRQREAQEAARSATRLLERLLEDRPADGAIRERLAEAHLLLGSYATAVAVVDQGKRWGDRPSFKPLLARAYVSWWDAVGAGNAKVDGPRLDLLKRAIDADPWNPLVFSRLASMKGPDASAARAMVAGLLAKGEAPPAAIHWILGNEAWGRGERVLAKSHMEQAYALAATNPLVLNNLAWMLAFSEPSDVPRALKLAEEGVRAAPKALELRDTRGRIYAKAGDWSKALAELQLCLAAKKSDPEFMAVLIEAAEKSGLPDLATQFKRVRDEQRSALPKTGPP